jgi:acetyl esterase/lipase
MTAESTRPARKGVLGFLPVLQFGTGLLSAWYIVLLNEIGREFSVSAAGLNWVNAIYMLATVVTVSILAKLGDVHGHRRMLIVATSIVTIGSIVIALAPNFEVLLVGRALQAPLAALLPLSFGIVRERAGESSGGAVARLVATATIGGALGGIGAGLLLAVFGGDLRLTLWLPAVVLAVCIPGVIFLVKETTVRATGGVDWLGGALLGGGLLLALGGFANAPAWGWTDPKTIAGILIGALLLAAWVVVERRVKHPLVDFRVLIRGGVGLPLVIGFVGGAQFFGSSTATTVFALSDPAVTGFGLGFTPATAGTIVILTTFGTFTTAFLGDRVARALGTRGALMLAGVLVATGYVAMILGGGIVAVFLTASVITGLGTGLMLSIVPATIVRLAPADSVGIASGLYNTARAAAGAIAGAVFAFVMASLAAGVGSEPGTGAAPFVAVWAICAALCLLFAVLSLFVREQPRRAGERRRATLRLRMSQGVLVAVSSRMAKSPPDFERSRAISEGIAQRLKVVRGVRETRDVIAGVNVNRYTRETPLTASAASGVVLHVHGGAYVGGSATFGRVHSEVTARAGIEVVSVDYRLAPEHPYPAAVDDALAVYRELVASQPVVVVGESAGGGLALALVQRIRDEGLVMPVAVVAMMPWADLTQSSSSYDLNRGRDVLTREGLTRGAVAYAGELDLADPRISPLFGSFDGFPPTLVLVGTHDSLLEDARAVFRMLTEAGVQAELVEIAGGTHSFAQMPAPEGREAMALIFGYLIDALSREPASR